MVYSLSTPRFAAVNSHGSLREIIYNFFILQYFLYSVRLLYLFLHKWKEIDWTSFPVSYFHPRNRRKMTKLGPA